MKIANVRLSCLLPSLFALVFLSIAGSLPLMIGRGFIDAYRAIDPLIAAFLLVIASAVCIGAVGTLLGSGRICVLLLVAMISVAVWWLAIPWASELVALTLGAFRLRYKDARPRLLPFLLVALGVSLNLYGMATLVGVVTFLFCVSLYRLRHREIRLLLSTADAHEYVFDCIL